MIPPQLTLTPALAASLAVFAFAASITPGPNNAMLLASGANFGLRRSLPHAAGVVAGFLGLVGLCGLGLGGLLRAFPLLHGALKWGGGAYLLWLAFRIATSHGVSIRRTDAQPLTVLQAVAFQGINPKGWTMALGVVATYLPAGYTPADLGLALLIAAAVNGPCVLTWTAFGVALRRLLDRPAVLRGFNIAMGLLLALSLVPLLFERG